MEDSRDVFAVDDLTESVGLVESRCFLNRDRSMAETWGRTTPFAMRVDGRTAISSSLSSESAMVDVVLDWAVANVPRDARRWGCDVVVRGVWSADGEGVSVLSCGKVACRRFCDP